jgi:CHAT domain-containing protein
VDQLGRNYRDVEVVLAGRDAPLAHDSTLRSYRVLHVAAHTRVDDQHPWRSGIALGGLSAGASAGWRASDIASRRLNASLAVLSGCESAGGRALTGEGVQGLSTAFLSAGVPAVVATLWPVSDHASARLMESFYRSLGRGESASAALRRAQLELARDTATRAPFYWAGFVLVGDPDVRVDLERRADTRAIAIAVAAGALLIAAGLWQRRRVLRIAQASRM